MNRSVTAIVVIIIALAVVGFIVYRSMRSKTGEVISSTAEQNTQNPVAETPAPTPTSATTQEALRNDMHRITIETNHGTIQFQTYDADAPKASSNFVALAQKGFYDNLTFHRVIKGFMIQGGDPKGDGTGGPGYQFADELNPATVSYQAGYKKGVMAMANAGPNTNGSQFFIMHADYPLPHQYTIFGHVVSGQEVVDGIASVSTNPANDMPLEPVVMTKVTVDELP